MAALVDNSGYNWTLPTTQPTQDFSQTPTVELNAPGYVNPAVKPIAPITGTNAGSLQIQPYYQTSGPQQSSYYWGQQSTNGTNAPTATPTNTPPAQAWGTGNGQANASNEFDVNGFMAKMLSPQMQAAMTGSAIANQKKL